MTDFNNRLQQEGKDDTGIVDNELDLFKQELDTLFSTSKTEVLGVIELGQNLEDLLWKTNFSNERIESELKNQITNYCLMNEYFNWNLKLSLYKGTVRDIAVIDMTISNPNNNTDNVDNVRWVFR